jgi:5-formyltetrahydrofolate cyclo-ligase
MDKPTLRTMMTTKRRALSLEQSRSYGAAIGLRLQSSVDWLNIKRIHSYRSNNTWREVDTSWLEAYAYATWPHISVDIGGVLKSTPLPTPKYDLIIVPMVAFDERLNRLGLGSGWYDTFLASQPNAIVIGLAYEFQRVSQLVAETHDQPMSLVVTEKATYS